MKKKVVFALILALCLLCLILTLAACGKEAQPNTPPSNVGTGGDTPSTGGNTPSTGGNTPSTGGNTPSTGENTPSTGGNTPAIGTEFTVTLDVEGCKPLEKTEYTVQYGKPCQLPVPKPANEIYTEFLGWAYNGIRLSASDGSIANWNIEQNATLKAEFGGCVLLVKDGVLVGHSDRIALVSDLVIPSEIDGQTITSIGGYAFEGCNTIASVSIPDGVQSMGECAFASCTGLKTVTIGDGVQNLASSAFDGCNSLKSIFIEEGNAIYLSKDGIVYNKTDKSIYFIPEALEGEVAILDGCVKINKSAFSGKGLTAITIPDSMQSIGERAFEKCTNLQTLNWNAINCAIEKDQGYPIFDYNNISLNNISTINIGANVQSIGADIFYGCVNITKVNVTSLKTWCEIEFGNRDANPLSAAQGNAKLYLNDALVTEVNDLDGVAKISAYAFYCCSDITSVTIPGSAQSIDEYAFCGCAGLSEITIPISVQSIGNSAFYDCTGLQSLTIGDGVQSIGYYAFRNCTGLKTVTIGDGVQSIGHDAFSYCTGITSVTIPDSVQSIGGGAFQFCRGITEVNYLGNFKGWCEIEFGGGSANPLSVTDGKAELYCNEDLVDLTNLTIPAGTTKIGEYAFYGLTGITSVTIPDSVKSIGEYAFSKCTGITSVIIPDSVQSIGEDAFSGCVNITKVNVTSLKTWCEIEFGNYEANPLFAANNNIAGTAKLYLNDALVTEVNGLDGVAKISAYAFYDCSDITSVIIPDSVQSIGSYAFGGCTGVEDIYYAGDETQWRSIDKRSGWDYNTPNYKRMHYNSTGPEVASNISALPSDQPVLIACDKLDLWVKQD